MMRLALAFGLALLAAGCGKVGDPSPAGPPSQITYPKIYPSQ